MHRWFRDDDTEPGKTNSLSRAQTPADQDRAEQKLPHDVCGQDGEEEAERARHLRLCTCVAVDRRCRRERSSHRGVIPCRTVGRDETNAVPPFSWWQQAPYAKPMLTKRCRDRRSDQNTVFPSVHRTSRRRPGYPMPTRPRLETAVRCESCVSFTAAGGVRRDLVRGTRCRGDPRRRWRRSWSCRPSTAAASTTACVGGGTRGKIFKQHTHAHTHM